MRAWQLHQIGEPLKNLSTEVVEDIAPPPPGMVNVAIESVGISFPDVLICRGEYQIETTLPHIPGSESAGRVDAVGEGVTNLSKGDRVTMLGGGLVELVQKPATELFKIPHNISSDKAAAIPINYATTWFALHDRASLKAGEFLLVTGAAGGTGSAAIQLGKAAGASVIAVVGGDEKFMHAKALGANEVIDHLKNPTWVETVREISAGGVDVAYDPVGGETTHQVRRCMKWGGRLLIIGFVAGIPDLPANHILLKNYSVIGVHWGASLRRDPNALNRHMAAVLELAATGTVDPLLYPPYQFEEAAQAIQDLAERKTWGKVIVQIG